MKNLLRTATLLLALCLLLGAVLTMTACDKPAEPPADPPTGGEGNGDGETDLPAFGSQIGNRCYNIDVALLGKTGETFNPANNKGKVTVINFWGTWCGPCKSELPDFDRVATEYADSVTVFAVHSVDKKEDPVTYVQENFPETAILFGQDSAGDMFYNMLSGSGYWPVTVILDGNGVIRYKHISGLSYEELKAAIDSVKAD